MNTLETPKFDAPANTNAGDPEGTRRSSTNPAQVDVRWREIQAIFVDDPRGAVQRADVLVREELHSLVNRLSAEQQRLAERWESASGDARSTEELRQCLTRYREIARRLRALGI